MDRIRVDVSRRHFDDVSGGVIDDVSRPVRGKGSSYSIAERRVSELIFAVSRQVT